MTPAEDLEYRYMMACATKSDIVDHLPRLRRLARGQVVVELGTRTGVSTLAFLAARPAVLYACDLQRPLEVDLLQHLAKTNGIPFHFWQADDLTIDIPLCHLLFIDTLHTYGQLTAELARHADKAQVIALHDTVTYGHRGEAGDPGLIPAIREFLAREPQWRAYSHDPECNGLSVLKRQPDPPPGG